MKKLLCLCLTVVMLVFCFGFVGCEKKDDINYTAERPWIDPVYATLDDEERTLTVNGCKLIKRCKSYIEFSEYYKEHLKGNRVYLLYRGNEVLPLTPYDEGCFDFSGNTETGEFIVEESYDYYDGELGSKLGDGKDGWKAVSVHLDILIKPTGKLGISELTFEFGKKISHNGMPEKYINMYSGEECFATCYFNNYVYIPQEWYENYLKTNLIYGDDLN